MVTNVVGVVITMTTYLTGFWLYIQFLDTSPRNKHLVTTTKARVGGSGERTVLKTLKQTVLLLVSGWGAEGDGLDLG